MTACAARFPAEGEGISMYILIKTEDEKILANQIKGAEAAVIKKNDGVVSSLHQSMNKNSTTKDGKNAGFLTVTTDLAALARMVADIADDD
mmetsp:Transcript_14134/g.23406  ORF Transcript_14134/g.23406 Transcript_14134/m.23406 type:complete len:91 (-) Transcript_14134:314-586(-)